MPFDLFAWAIGFGLSKSAGAAASWVLKDTLPKKLNAVAHEWASALPGDRWVEPQALVSDAVADHELSDRPKLGKLRSGLRERTIPGENTWEEALVEQWALTRSRLGHNAQPFFLLSEADARLHLSELSRALFKACRDDEPLFRGTVLGLLDEILASGLRPSSVGLPSPIEGPFEGRSLARLIEAETGSHIHAVLMFAKSKRLWIWGRFFGSGLQEQRWTLACAARLVSRMPDIESLHLGFSAASDLPGSDGSGLVGWLIVQVPKEKLLVLSEQKGPPPDFWDELPTFACAPEQAPFERWEKIKFREFEELLP